MGNDDLTEAQAEALGKELVALFALDDDPPVRDREGVPYDPPRYRTSEGTKTALGLGRTVERKLREARQAL